MYIAIDDTDSTSWMCTTYLATVLIDESGLDLIGLPRLVRLNPAVPWKTRGNGAICLRLGEGRGERQVVGRITGSEVVCYRRCAENPPAPRLLETGMEIVKRWSRVSEGASPGVVVSKRKPRQSLYWAGVRDLLDREEVTERLREVDALWDGLGGARGIIGAAAAMAWRPRNSTYEVLSYRTRKRWGAPRQVSEEDAKRLDHLLPSTFNNYDWEEGRMAITPHSPCPVLYGVRGDSWRELLRAVELVRSEPVDRWLLFQTNQGTDDHIVRGGPLLPGRSYSLTGEVIADPQTIVGGHVVVTLRLGNGAKMECAAYEPSKGFRERVRALRPGDRVRVVGELREFPRTLNLEKMQVLSLSPQTGKVANPICPSCGRRMKSAGRGEGYRCRRCGVRAGEEEAERRQVERGLEIGWYEPPVCARRHLSRPLKLSLRPLDL